MSQSRAIADLEADIVALRAAAERAEIEFVDLQVILVQGPVHCHGHGIELWDEEIATGLERVWPIPVASPR